MTCPSPLTLPSRQIRTEIDESCRNYSRKLLLDLGVPVSDADDTATTHPARRWAESGLMFLVGNNPDQPRLCPVPLPGCADAALDAFRTLSRVNIFPSVDGAQLLTERAAVSAGTGLRSGPAGGTCRLLRTRDGVIGLNLPRQDDWDLIPAWLEGEPTLDWKALYGQVLTADTAALVARARTLGLAAVDARSIPRGEVAWQEIAWQSRATGTSPARRIPRVLDLSSLWAGPLCSHLWQAAGAHVIKVEGSRRPDGARFGSREFFDLLNRGKESLRLDLHNRKGQDQLRALLREVDIVLEASRPRALRQMGIVAEEIIEANPGLTWVSISGYGRREPGANWIAFGDDAGIAAGLSAILHQVSGDWLICGDAIADPLTGLHAALAGWASWLAGGGRLLDMSLEGVVRHCICATAPQDNNFRERYAQWWQYLRDHHIQPAPPAHPRGRLISAP